MCLRIWRQRKKSLEEKEYAPVAGKIVWTLLDFELFVQEWYEEHDFAKVTPRTDLEPCFEQHNDIHPLSLID